MKIEVRGQLALSWLCNSVNKRIEDGNWMLFVMRKRLHKKRISILVMEKEVFLGKVINCYSDIP